MKRKILCLCLMVGLLLSFGMMGSAKSFDDTDGHWAESSIEKWSEYEVINGKPQNKFDPNGFMTRAEASAVFSRLLVLEKRDSIEKFKDIDFNAWYTESLEKCVAAGILNGDGNNMNPDGYITREMFFVMIARALSIPTEEFSTTNFDDEKDVSLWAEQYVNALVNKKYVNGVEGNRIAPKENITRASVITLLDRIVKNYVIEDGTYISNTENGIALVLADNCKVYSGFDGTIVVATANISIDLNGANDADIIIKGDNITVKNAPSSTTVVVDSGVENVEVNGNKVDSGISFTVKSLETEKETKPTVSPSRPHSHNYIPTVTKNPTCTEDGVKTFKCSCGNSYTEPIEKLSENDTHTPKSAVKENETEGNCETKATYDEVVYCSVCDEELSRTEKTGDFGDHSPKAAVKENETEGDCKTKITYDEVVYCSICNDELSRTQKEGNFGAHSPKSAVKENETTGNCKTKATYDEVVYCSLCDEELSRTQKSGNYGEHSPKIAVKENEKAGNCKTKATYDEVVYCSICDGEISRTEKTGELGDHSPKTAVKENETEGDCKTKITYDEVIYCSICDDELCRTEKTGSFGSHSPKAAVKENETTGNCKTRSTYDEVVYCSICNDELSRTEKTGDFGDHSPKAAVKENETEGNCKTNATYDEVVYCSVCDEELSRTEKTGDFGDHSPKAAVKENETEGDCKTKITYDEVVYCSICDDELSRTEKTGDYGDHKYVSGKCEYCEERDPDAPITEPTIVISNVTASAGDTVEVELSIVNNPGIAGATVSIEYPVGVVFDEATNGDAFATLDFSHTNGLPNPCNLTWDSESGQTTSNGTIANLKFTVPADAKSGDTFEIKCSYKYGDIYNDSWDDVEITFINGFIRVE